MRTDDGCSNRLTGDQRFCRGDVGVWILEQPREPNPEINERAERGDAVHDAFHARAVGPQILDLGPQVSNPIAIHTRNGRGQAAVAVDEDTAKSRGGEALPGGTGDLGQGIVFRCGDIARAIWDGVRRVGSAVTRMQELTLLDETARHDEQFNPGRIARCGSRRRLSVDDTMKG
jgi:hypothetical protein